MKHICMENVSQRSCRAERGDWFSLAKDEANLIHQRGVNGAVFLAGGGG